MGIFKKTRQSLIEDPATVAVDGETIETTLPQKQPQPAQEKQQQQPQQSIAQWKKARKKERKANAVKRANQKEQRASRIHQLVLHRSANRSGGPQNEYCYSPNVVVQRQKSAKKAASVGWGTAQIAMKGVFGGLGRKDKIRKN